MNEPDSYRFFSNTHCQYFPCHPVSGDGFNCLFCYCPLYALGEDCGGHFEYLPSGVKSCMNCALPHSRNGYDYIMSKIDEIIKLASK